MPNLPDLRAYLELLKKEEQLLVISDEVDPYLEIAEIHRRVIAKEGPALFFTKVRITSYNVCYTKLLRQRASGG